MISTVLRVSLLNLKRDKPALILSFVVPLAIFSVFAVIFGSMGRSGMPRLELAIVDEDDSEMSRRLAAALEREPSLKVVRPRSTSEGGPARPATRADAEGWVKTGKLGAAVILPKGLGDGFPRFDAQGAAIEVLNDSSNPIAGQMLVGLLQKVVMTGLPDAFMKGGIDQFEKYAGRLTPEQRKAVDEWLPRLKKESAGGQGPNGAAQAEEGTSAGLIPIKTVDLLGQTKRSPAIAFYAAGTAVMFLLFSCAHGGGGTMLEEVESGTLDRLLSSNLTMPQLLLGKWLWLTAAGFLQVTVMFIWGWLVFQVELPSHLAGFAVMTLAAASAASSFGLILGTLCRTRAQLAGMATTVILMMSAVGGSMFPRFLMPPFMKSLGLLTFNGWALDGYQKVFWFEAPVWQLWPQVLVLFGSAILFLVAARLLARRWETA